MEKETTTETIEWFSTAAETELKGKCVYPPPRGAIGIPIPFDSHLEKGRKQAKSSACMTRVVNVLCIIAVKPGPQSLSSPEHKQSLAFIES